MENKITRSIFFKRKEEEFLIKEDVIVEEKALTLYANDSEIATVVCSPWELEYMSYGFLFSEGILRDIDDVEDFYLDEEKGQAYLEIKGFEENPSGRLFMKRVVNTCCGRSRASFYYSNDALLAKTVDSKIQIKDVQVFTLMEELEEQAVLFKETGGVHSAALTDGKEILSFHQDIGRHNTLDRILGQAKLEKTSLEDKMILFSGRVASEIVLKISKMGIPILISRSAPSSLALDLAEDLGITVIGFARENRFSVYTHPERVEGIDE